LWEMSVYLKSAQKKFHNASSSMKRDPGTRGLPFRWELFPKLPSDKNTKRFKRLQIRSSVDREDFSWSSGPR
jgi:hypothetical protein